MLKITQNKITITLILIIGAFLLVYYFVFPLIVTSIWKATNKDIKNVTIEGFVYDNKNKPTNNYKLQFTNYYYEGGDGDSYMGGETILITTNKKGFYIIHLNKSCFIQIDNMSNKNLIDTLIIEKYLYKRKNRIDISLKKE